jgi:hypothetical protein
VTISLMLGRILSLTTPPPTSPRSSCRPQFLQPKMSTLPEYNNDPTISITENFSRLAIQEGWKKKSKSYKEGRRVFIADAVEIGFISHFGVNDRSLQAWQSLCRTIGVENVENLTSISSCQKVTFGFVRDNDSPLIHSLLRR